MDEEIAVLLCRISSKKMVKQVNANEEEEEEEVRTGMVFGTLDIVMQLKTKSGASGSSLGTNCRC